MTTTATTLKAAGLLHAALSAAIQDALDNDLTADQVVAILDLLKSIVEES